MIRAISFMSVILAAQLSAANFPDPPTQPNASAKGKETVVLAGGCFWGVEAVFERLRGVSEAVSGYAGGSKSTAQYETVSTGRTGHAESVKVTYDPSQITFGTLLKVYFSVAHDPTQLNRQGPDSGPQYRSEIFYTNPEQKHVAEDYIRKLDDAKVYRKPIVTKVASLEGFYAAESYHQHYLDRNPRDPYIVFNDLPKLRHLQENYPDLLKKK
jgi:peptide-methionine (S)-S-oxide reductase